LLIGAQKYFCPRAQDTLVTSQRHGFEKTLLFSNDMETMSAIDLLFLTVDAKSFVFQFQVSLAKCKNLKTSSICEHEGGNYNA